MPLAFDREIAPRRRGLALVPTGQARIARRFNAGFGVGKVQVPKGTAEGAKDFSRPFGTRRSVIPIPALKRRAILSHPFRDGDEKLVALDFPVWRFAGFSNPLGRVEAQARVWLLGPSRLESRRNGRLESLRYAKEG